MAARHGGEEFAVLLRYTDGPHAYAIAERIRQGIEEHRFEHDGRVLRVRASIGLGSLEGRCYRSWQGLIEAADAYLYKAKQQGRNRTHYVGMDASARLTQTTVSLRRSEFQAAQARERSPAAPAPESPAGKPSAPGASKRRRPRR